VLIAREHIRRSRNDSLRKVNIIIYSPLAGLLNQKKEAKGFKTSLKLVLQNFHGYAGSLYNNIYGGLHKSLNIKVDKELSANYQWAKKKEEIWRQPQKKPRCKQLQSVENRKKTRLTYADGYIMYKSKL